MRPEEAARMAEWIRALALPQGATVLNVGSSTHAFRTIDQPHIDALLIKPLEDAGMRVIHCDMKPDVGVDEVGDLLDPAFRDTLKRYDADVMICSNLLEHLTDPQQFVDACGELVREGGYGLVTVPKSYPYHADPIDTMLRPTPEQLAGMLCSWHVERAEALALGSYRDDLKRHRHPLRRLVMHLGRVALPFYRPAKWRALAHRLLWLWREYEVSMVLLRKPGQSSAVE